MSPKPHRDFAARNMEVETSLSPQRRQGRLVLLAAACLVWGAAITYRLFSLQISDVETWQEWALKQHLSQFELASVRGPILDRNGKLLALSVPAGSIYVRPKLVRERDRAVRELSTLLGLHERQIRERLASSQPFVWVRRQIPRPLAERIEQLKIAGVGAVLESRRVYPYGSAGSILVGKAGVDGEGLSGAELAFERTLHVQDVRNVVARDALGKRIAVDASEALELPAGAPVQLTIDAALQLVLDEELERGRVETDAAHTLGALIDAETGEILALGQSPSPDFNRDRIASGSDLKNLVLETVFEPGSTLKPIVAAAALDEQVIGAHELIDCEGGRFRFARHTINDVHPYDTISLRDVLVRSSNIGMTKIGTRLGAERLYSSLRGFGFGAELGLGLPGETPGILRNVRQWAQIDVATHSFGQGIAVTPLHMARAFAAIANGGRLPKLSIVRDGTGFESRRVISERSAAIVREMSYGVVEDRHGTGRRAAVHGVRVGGKTGTAQKASKSGRGYESGAYVASFVGFADGTPRGVPRNLVLMIAVDEPDTDSIYGGTLAAPIFSRVMTRAFDHLAATEYLGGSRRPDLAPAGYERAAAPAQRGL